MVDPIYIPFEALFICPQLSTIKAPSYSTTSFNEFPGGFFEVLVPAGLSRYDLTLEDILHDVGPTATKYPVICKACEQTGYYNVRKT